jgi:hypothetical protein
VSRKARSEWETFLESLSQVDARRRALEREIFVCVSAARAAGVPWSMIGAALGVSKQAAQRRFSQH